MSEAGKINVYTCRDCGAQIVTVDRVKGVTPMNLLCKTAGCKGWAVSAWYMVDQSLTPEYEFFRPKKLPKDPGMRDHIQRGGLDLRKIP